MDFFLKDFLTENPQLTDTLKEMLPKEHFDANMKYGAFARHMMDVKTIFVNVDKGVNLNSEIRAELSEDDLVDLTIEISQTS